MLLAPMSAVAGRMSVQAGAHCLKKPKGEVLLGGAPGGEPANVLILGEELWERMQPYSNRYEAKVHIVDKSEAN